MWQLKEIETGNLMDCQERPRFVVGVWECGNFRVTDVNGAGYEVIEPTTVYPKVSPIEFKLMFTSIERIAIKTSTDPIVQDFFELVENQRIVNASDASRGLIDFGLQSTRDALGYMQSIGLLAEGRIDEILTGVIT